MAGSLDRACRRYERALTDGRGTKRWDADVAAQAHRYRRRMAFYREVDGRVKHIVLSSADASAALCAYLNYGRRLAHLCTRFSGLTLRRSVRLATEIGQARGLRPEIMGGIRRRVFGLHEDDAH